MNRKLAAVGLLLVFVALAVGSGAFPSGDELTDPEADGSVFLAPADSPNGEAYVELRDDEIVVTIERVNPSAETLINELFEVGYEGNGTAEVWIRHGSDSVTFLDGNGAPIENETQSDRLFLSSGEVSEVGMEVNSKAPAERLEQVTLVALIPTSERDDIIVSPPPTEGGEGGGGGGGDGGTFVPSPQPTPDSDTGTDIGTGAGGDRAFLNVDLGQLTVQFRQPEFVYATDVSDDEVGISPGAVSQGVATVIDEEEPVTEETIFVDGTVENTGNAFGTAIADLRVNGRSIESREVELAPGENRTVSFALAFDEPGRYEVAVGDSEPVTVFVTEEGIDIFPWALVAAILSLIALILLYRRWKEDEEEEEAEGEGAGAEGAAGDD